MNRNQLAKLTVIAGGVEKSANLVHEVVDGGRYKGSSALKGSS